MAFSDPVKLAQNPDVDLVTISVKVPDHYTPVMAAIEAGKHVYCEWPLGRDTNEATRMLTAAGRKGVSHAVGLRALSATVIACAPNWGSTIDRAYQADRANLLTITGGHTIDTLCDCLGEFHELSAFVVSQRDRIPLEGTGEIIAKTSPDQLVVNGVVGDGSMSGFESCSLIDA